MRMKVAEDEKGSVDSRELYNSRASEMPPICEV